MKTLKRQILEVLRYNLPNLTETDRGTIANNITNQIKEWLQEHQKNPAYSTEYWKDVIDELIEELEQ
jgi:hypothetical protein